MIINTEASIIYGTVLTDDEFVIILNNDELLNQIQEMHMVLGPLAAICAPNENTEYMFGKEVLNSSSYTPLSFELTNHFTSQESKLYKEVLKTLEKEAEPQFYLTSHIY